MINLKEWEEKIKEEIDRLQKEILYAISTIRGEIEEAIAFYNKYMSNPNKFIEDYPGYREIIEKMWWESESKFSDMHSATEDYLKNYNKWLLLKAFNMEVMKNDR